MKEKVQRKDFLKLAALLPFALATKPLHAFVTGETDDNVVYFRKGSAEYEQLRQGFNKRINKFPAVIALCKNTQGVAEAVKYAAKNNLPVAIKSGGHCMEGFSCNDGGMVINLSLLNKTAWVDKETIMVEPACTLSSLYDTLLPKGRILPGGSCGSVAVAGLALGGGYGLLARKFGLTCDSLLEATMVDGNGNIVNTANDPELLWGCKGGGNGNFGVITQMKFRTYKAPATLESYRFKSYKVTTAKAKAVLQDWFAAAAKLPAGCFSAYVLNGKTVYILLTNADRHEPVVQEFIDTMSAISEKTTRTKPQPLAKALKVFYGIQHPVYFKNASAGLYRDYASIAPFIDKVIDKVLAAPGMIYQVNTLGGNIYQPEKEAASAFPHRAYGFFSELQTYWEMEKQAKGLMDRFEKVQQVFAENGIAAQYRNYPDINFAHWEKLYYGNSYGRLAELKKKYDPAGVIRHEQSIK